MSLRIILASASPRRIELLHQIGIQAQVMPSHKPEVVTSTDPATVVWQLSRQKAEDIVAQLGESKISRLPDGAQSASGHGEHQTDAQSSDDIVVIGADTVVAIDGRILGKPKTHEEAYNMICELSGRPHHVYTGVTVCYRGRNDNDKDKSSSECCGCREETFVEVTTVHVADMSEEEIRAYANSEEPMDKAGGYGIQGLFGRYISGIEGDYNNVVGLPVAHLYHVLKSITGTSGDSPHWA